MNTKETEVKTLNVIEPIISPEITQAIATLREVQLNIRKWNDKFEAMNGGGTLTAYSEFDEAIVTAAYSLSDMATNDIMKNCYYMECGEDDTNKTKL